MECERIRTDLPPRIVRTERGLSLAGTRITLYDVMDYLHGQWAPERIHDILRLTDDQPRAALDDITAERDEAEYQLVLADAAVARRYWEDRNRERLAQAPRLPPQPERAALRARLAAERARQAEEEARRAEA
ncbi:MAG TPA: hypothetical protein VIC85_19285 [Ktedonobacterales bacterium]